MDDAEKHLEEYELLFEEINEGGFIKRIGRSKTTGLILLVSKLDRERREIEKCSFDDGGRLRKRVVYEYDEKRKPVKTLAFDANDKLIYRQERGKRPEIIE